MKTKEYCEYCGHQLKPYNTGLFDKDTGKKRVYFRCGNAYCERGCRNLGGHVFKKIKNWWIFTIKSNKCSRCGYVR
jgi:hypothetical protein